jgi:hypothetical protein
MIMPYIFIWTPFARGIGNLPFSAVTSTEGQNILAGRLNGSSAFPTLSTRATSRH